MSFADPVSTFRVTLGAGTFTVQARSLQSAILRAQADALDGGALKGVLEPIGAQGAGLAVETIARVAPGPGSASAAQSQTSPERSSKSPIVESKTRPDSQCSTGALIRKARRDARLSQSRLAARVGVTTSLISHLEADRKTVTDFVALGEALGVDPESLKGEGPRPKGNGGQSRKDNPPPQGLPEANPLEPFMNIRQLLDFLEETYGKRVSYGQVYEWVAKHGLPAYENKLRLSPRGEKTLAFRESEVALWLTRTIQPLKIG